MANKIHEIDELRWVRLFSPIHVPKYLVDQIKDKDFSVDDFFKYQELNCLIPGKESPVLSPFNHLYGMVDPENLVKGFLWFVIDPLSKDVVINSFSVDKEYWGKGKAVERLSDHVKEILKKLKLKKAYWITNYPRHSQKYGFRRSRGVLMEYDPAKDEEEAEEEKNAEAKKQETAGRA